MIAPLLALALTSGATPALTADTAGAPSIAPSVEVARVRREPAPWLLSGSVDGAVRSWTDDSRTVKREDILDGMMRLRGFAGHAGVEAGVQVDAPFASPAARAGMISAATAPVGWNGAMLGRSDSEAAVLEKKFLRARGGGWRVELGDSYHSLGRGLLLALVKNTDVDVDTTLEGAAGEGWAGPFHAELFGGLSNPQTVAATFPNYLVRDPRDRIAGGRLEATGGPLTVGAHALLLHSDPDRPGSTPFGATTFVLDEARAAGGTVALDLGRHGEFFAEADSLDARGSVDGAAKTIPGHGFYAAATAFAGAFTLVIEGKDYRNLRRLNTRSTTLAGTPYSSPPTLEKENIVTPKVAELLNSENVAGGRARLSFASHGTIARVSLLHEKDLGEVLGANETADHLWAGIEHRFRGGAFFSTAAGYRYETRLADSGLHDRLAHAELDLIAPNPAWRHPRFLRYVYRDLVWEAKVLAYASTEHQPPTDAIVHYQVNQLSLSARAHGVVSLTALLDTTNDPRVIGAAGGRHGNLSKDAFGGAELEVRPTPASSLRFFGGATRGGLVCAGGTCRVLPSFSGARMEWSASW